MPELPEVETIARWLREGSPEGPALLGRTFQAVEVLWPRTLAAPDPATFIVRLPGRRVTAIGRRGKFLRIWLDDGAVLLLHLRMSGDLRWQPPPATAPHPHDRLVFHFADGWRLGFNDPRKFGRVWLVNDEQTVLGDLGPEPLDPAFSAEDFYARLRRSRTRLKALLLDQRFLAGLGNIYADEALFQAGLHPLRPAHTLTPPEAERLFHAIRQVLQAGIAHHGASIDWVYRGGDFQNHFAVYRRAGQPCRRCGTPIQRLVIGQRGSHFCPHCQPPPEG